MRHRSLIAALTAALALQTFGLGVPRAQAATVLPATVIFNGGPPNVTVDGSCRTVRKVSVGTTKVDLPAPQPGLYDEAPLALGFGSCEVTKDSANARLRIGRVNSAGTPRFSEEISGSCLPIEVAASTTGGGGQPESKIESKLTATELPGLQTGKAVEVQVEVQVPFAMNIDGGVDQIPDELSAPTDPPTDVQLCGAGNVPAASAGMNMRYTISIPNGNAANKPTLPADPTPNFKGVPLIAVEDRLIDKDPAKITTSLFGRIGTQFDQIVVAAKPEVVAAVSGGNQRATFSFHPQVKNIKVCQPACTDVKVETIFNGLPKFDTVVNCLKTKTIGREELNSAVDELNSAIDGLPAPVNSVNLPRPAVPVTAAPDTPPLPTAACPTPDVTNPAAPKLSGDLLGRCLNDISSLKTQSTEPMGSSIVVKLKAADVPLATGGPMEVRFSYRVLTPFIAIKEGQSPGPTSCPGGHSKLTFRWKFVVDATKVVGGGSKEEYEQQIFSVGDPNETEQDEEITDPGFGTTSTTSLFASMNAPPGAGADEIQIKLHPLLLAEATKNSEAHFEITPTVTNIQICQPFCE